MDCFVGIDLGTHAVKTIAIDENGRSLALRERRYPILQPSPGFAEQSPQDWWSATTACLHALLEAPEMRNCRIRSVGLSGQMHGLVALDERGMALRNAIIWPDTRTAEICREWSESGSAEQFTNVTGLPLATGFLGTSLEWLRRKEPDVFQKTAMLLLPKDYVRLRLTNVIATDPSDASGTYLFDIRDRQWSDLVLEGLGFNRSILPPIMRTLSIAGEVSGAAAEETGLPKGTPVAVGGSDQAMAALALGLERPGQVAVAISTGGTIITRINSVIVDSRLHTLCDATEDSWLLMGAALSAGSAISWFTEQVVGVGASASLSGETPSIDRLVSLADAVPAGSNGLFFLPYLSGDRTPHMNPNAQGSFVGLTLYHSAAHFVRAILEGVAYSLHGSVALFREHGLKVEETLCYAGGSQSAVWRQIIADVFDSPVEWRLFSDYSALGAAHCGARALGTSVPLSESARAEGDLRIPRPREVDIYRKRRATFEELYQGLEPFFEKISKYRE